MFKSGLQVSRNHGDGYNSHVYSFVEGTRSLFDASAFDAGTVKLTSEDADDDVVDQPWTVVGPALNSTVGRMRGLLTWYGIRSEDMSPFLRHFDSPSDLLGVYLILVPSGIEGGTASDDTVDDDKVEATSATSAPVTSEDRNLDSLSEAIRLVMGDANLTTNIESNELEDTTEDVSEPSTTDDADVFAGDDTSLAEVGTKCVRMFDCTTMQELIDASVEGMSLLHLKGNYTRGSTSDLQKYKSLLGS